MSEAQHGAPMAMADGALTPSASGAPQSMPMETTPFGAPTTRPGEPVTSGAPMGAGPGPESLGLPSAGQLQEQDAQAMLSALPVWEFMANMPGASPSTRAIVRKIKSLASGF